jgi:YidC/Oxa1 family membrane protein insertase
MQNNKNILIATTLSAVVLLSWTWLYEKPRMEKAEAQKQVEAALKKQEKAEEAVSTKALPKSDAQSPAQPVALASGVKHRDEVLADSNANRVKILSENLHGSIALKGAKFDDLTLAQFFVKSDKKDEVVLFSPAESKERYFADFGWISSEQGLELPKPDTIWQADGKTLSPETPVTLSWKNKQNIEFSILIALDENYMFDVTQKVRNLSNKGVTLASYGRINRFLNNTKQSTYILHEGPIGVFGKILSEVPYQKISEEKKLEFSGTEGDWLGISDKYWLSSIVPDKNMKFNASFTSDVVNQNRFFNSEFVGQEFEIAAGEELKFQHHMFAGAKKIRLLDQYAKEYGITLFDRAIDFGWFYFLTKPFFFIIELLNKLLGNFGLAILAMTVMIKLALFPMANKSYTAIAKMKKLQPKLEELRLKTKGDKLAMNREMMELYKKEKINPASGCLPILIQIPVFFALYKVLFVTLDMRQAPFYGWIHDLSAPDPTSIFNLFGLLPFEVSSTFTIGIWPILMGVTMVIQQKLTPQSADPTQTKILKFMPYVLTFVLASFPAGLVIYWTWSNLLSILQQWVITKKLNKAKA